MTEESRFLSFMGMRVHFSVARPEGEIKNRMLFLGSPWITTFQWRKLLPELEQLGYLTVSVDLPGFGLSDCGEQIPQDAGTRANIVWGILDSVDAEMDSPMSLWHLTGHGCVCPTILRMANLYPDSTKSMILISPLFSISPEGRSRDYVRRWFHETVFSRQNFSAFMHAYAGYPLDDYILDRMREPMMRHDACESFLRVVSNTLRAPSRGMGFCPTMALWGLRDRWMNEAALSEIRRLLPEAETHVLKSAGHLPMETHSRALRDFLRGWLKFNDQ